MSALISAFVAVAWMCTSPLTLPANPQIVPLSPVTLALTADKDGSFIATGTALSGDTPNAVTWTGRWSVIDADLALIGPWQEGSRITEMRSLSTVAKADVLILNLRETEHKGHTLRCLEEMGGA